MADPNNVPNPTVSRRSVLTRAGLGALAITGAASPTQAQFNKDNQPDPLKDQPVDPPNEPYAFIDGTGHGWVELGEKDFTNVNGHDDTWAWRDGVLYCTGKPISVNRTVKTYTNVEISFEWNHREKGGNSGMFVWADEKVIHKMAEAGKPGLPNGIEVQILDLGYEEKFKAGNPDRDSSWFTSHGDVFPVRVQMTPFPPLSPNGSRSFPTENRVRPHNHWNHYYIRAINGEVRLWVNGKEVSGGNNCDPRSGYLCLEAEGAPIEFRNIRVRELP